MAGNTFTSKSIPFASVQFNGGLNSTASPLVLQDNESSELQNVDFNRFGSVLKRNGYVCLNTDAGKSLSCDGLFWFQYDNSGTTVRQAIRVYDAKLEKMDDLDGVWDDITGGITITSTNHFDFASFTNTLYGTNGVDVPFKSAGGGTAVAMDIPSGLTKSKYIKVFENYMFLANVTVSGTTRPTRVHFSGLRDATSWDGADWIEVGLEDGQDITGLAVLSDRLVIFKERSIYNMYFTSDAAYPFILKKANSSVGCTSFSSIQEVNNGLVFHSFDGFYFYDGLNSSKISDKITTTLDTYNSTNFTSMRSLKQDIKNKVWWTFTDGGQTTNDKVVIWDWFNNAWSIYSGLAPSAMATFYVNGVGERPYFSDYNGFVYRGDFGPIDFPLNTSNAIDSYYYTNWRNYGDIVNSKGVPHTFLYYKDNSAVLTFSYAYDLDNGDTYSKTLNTNESGTKWDNFKWDQAKWSKSGGGFQRIDLTGRGRLIRFKVANATSGESFRIDGLGQEVYGETSA